MRKQSKFFIFNKTVTTSLSAVDSAICTAFLISKGFSILSISVVFSISLITVTILEYPSGNLADKIGRKKLFSIGLLFRGLQFFLFLTASNIYTLYLAAVFEGIYSSFDSGSLEAWLKGENSKNSKENVEYSKVFGLSKSLGSLFSIIALITVSLLLKVDLIIVYITMCIVYIILFIMVIVSFDDNIGNKKNASVYMVQTIKDFYKNTKFKNLTLMLSGTFAVYSIYMLYFQPKALELGLQEKYLASAGAIYLFGTFISSYLYSKTKSGIENKNFILYSFIGVLIAFFLFLTSFNLKILFLANFVCGISLGSLIPIFFSWSMEFVDSDSAASMLSLMSGISSIIAALTTIVIGFVIDKTNLDYSIYIGIIFILVSLFVIIYKFYFQKKISLQK